ncbi:hypothetical protein ACH4FX_03085 [Streptomyces sp. NPDC018019]|uniref:hypothetical protein n=1 Tax=Streptomyces sp. NPDC018019 TaxID=3365030 RepID=UPI0037893364
MITLPVHLRVLGHETEVGTVTVDAAEELPGALAELLHAVADCLAEQREEEGPT